MLCYTNRYVSMRAFYFWIWKSKNFKNWWRYEGFGAQILGWNGGILPPKTHSTNFKPPKSSEFQRKNFSSKRTRRGPLREKFLRRENEIFVSKKFAPSEKGPKMAIFNLWQIYTPPKTTGTQIWPMLPDRACNSLPGSIAQFLIFTVNLLLKICRKSNISLTPNRQ